MGTSYPDKTNATGIWKISDIYKNKTSDGTYPQSGTIGLFMGGYDNPGGVNNIEQIICSTSGNATDFGDLAKARQQFAGMSDAHGGLQGG